MRKLIVLLALVSAFVAVPTAEAEDTGAWTPNQERLQAGERIVVARSELVTRSDGIHRQTLIGTEKPQSTAVVSRITGIAAGKLGRCGIAKISLLEEGNWPFYVNLYRYSMSRGRCWNGVRLTSVYRLKRWNEYDAPGYAWFFCCHIDFGKSVGVKTAWSYTQGRYDRCILGKGCFDSASPSLEMILRWDGRVIRHKEAG